MRNFSGVEMLNKDDKFFCDTCCSLQVGDPSPPSHNTLNHEP